MDHAPVNPYHSAAHHLQHPHQALHQQNVSGFNQSFVPFPQQYYAQQAPGLNNTSYAAAPGTTSHSTAPPNNTGLRYPQQQFNLPVHNTGTALPAQRRATQPQHAPVPAPQLPQLQAQAARIEPSGGTKIGANNSSGNGNIKADKHLKGLKSIPEPQDKDLWRQRLFDVDGLMILTEEQFQVYFPHVDNVYSHRSTQDYKNKPFISHYYDCRLKGRPSGTPKSDDPNKKKRKRKTRERDLCEVKIKITEYQPGATREEIAQHLSQQPSKDGISAEGLLQRLQGAMGHSWHPGMATNRFYTIQRINGTGPHAKEAELGPHRHTLDDSDRIKKNSVLRSLNEKERKKKPSYHTKPTGAALATSKKHSKDHSLKLYGSCFCPFVQRVWISLEYKQLDYQYVEIDPYQKPEWYLKINPRGLVPSLQDGDWFCYESTVLMEYLEDRNHEHPLLPADPKKRAHSRLWTDHINRKIVPLFYAYLQAQDAEKQVEEGRAFKEQIEKLVEAADQEGPFFLGSTLGFVDIQFAPWVVRLNRVLKPYRGWPEPDAGSRWARWIKAIEEDPVVKSTTSTDELYFDSYERYAQNRPNTSQVANAINSGKGLP